MARILRNAVRSTLETTLQARTLLSTVNVNTNQAVQVTRRFDEQWQSLERVVIGGVRGAITIPTFKSGVKRSRDSFEIDVFVYVGISGQDAEDNEDRCTALVEDVVDALLLTATLNGSVTGMFECVPTTLDGPNQDLTEVNGVVTHCFLATLTVACTVEASS